MVLCLLASIIPSQLVLAASYKLYMVDQTTPPPTMNIGATFTINVKSYGDTEQTTGTANGSVTYPSGLLRVTNVTNSGSGYSSQSTTQGTGTIGFTSSRNPAPAGAAQIFTVTFQAIGAGTATVGFSPASQVNGTATLLGTKSYTINNPNPPPVVPSSTPKPVATPKPSTAPVPVPVPVTTPATNATNATTDTALPQPVPDPTGLIDTVIVDSLYTSSTVTWKVNAASPAASLSYGTSSSQIDKQATVTKKDDGTFTSTISELTPGIRYYFSINGSGSGGKTGTYSGSIITRGFPVVMTLTENNIAVKNAQVKIGNRSYTTDANGKLAVGLATGDYSVTVTTDTASLTTNLSVVAKSVPSDSNAPESQAFSYDLTSSPLQQAPGSEFSIFGFIGILLGGTVVLGLGFVGFMAYRRRQFESGAGPRQDTAPTVIIQDGYDWHQNDNASEPVTDHSLVVTPEPPRSEVDQPTRKHNNSVHLDEQEPLDMFEQAKIHDATPHTYK